MTCGICNPEGFKEAWQASHWIKAKASRVWGYAVAAEPTALAAQIRTLNFHGGARVLADAPTGEVRKRPGFTALSHPIILREGDTLLLADNKALGADPDDAADLEQELEERGVAVWLVTVEGDASE